MKCKHFGICGGCSFWHDKYAEELKLKEDEVRSLFSFSEVPIFSILPSPKILHYRNKMEFSFRENLNKDRQLGLMAKKKFVLDMDECLICPPWFIEVKNVIRNWWIEKDISAYFPPKNRGILRTLTLREGARTHQKMVILTVNGQENFTEEKSLHDILVPHLLPDDTLILRRQFCQKNVATYFEETVLFGRGYIQDEMKNDKGFYRFTIQPMSFFQPNTFSAEVLYLKALELANLKKEDVIFDLYCGTGTIGIFASSKVKKVYGIETNAEAVSDAQLNLRSNFISNMTVQKAEVEEALLEEKPHCIFIDPPRVGLSKKAIAQILNLKVPKIIYISCKPQSQAENVKTFLENGYAIQAIQPVDQFPHTLHVENIVVLVSRV